MADKSSSDVAASRRCSFRSAAFSMPENFLQNSRFTIFWVSESLQDLIIWTSYYVIRTTSREQIGKRRRKRRKLPRGWLVLPTEVHPVAGAEEGFKDWA